MSLGKHHRWWVRFICTIVSVLMIVSMYGNREAHAAGITMTLPNASFEEVGTGIPNWNIHPTFGTDTATVSDVRAYTGAKSMKMVDASSSSSLARVSDKISISSTEQVAYTATAYAYIEQGSIDVYLIFYTGTTEFRAIPASVTPMVDQWNKRSITAEAPAGATEVAVLIYSGLGSITTAYIDDVSIGKTVKNPGFETDLSGSWTVSGAAASTTVKTGGSFSLKLDDASSLAASYAESSDVPVSSNARVSAAAKVYVSSGDTGVSMHLRFKNAAGTVIKEVENVFSGSASQWTPLTISATTPNVSGAKTVSVYFTTKTTATTVAYVDDVTLDTPIEYNLGTQIVNNPLDGAVFGKDASGSYDLMYVGSSGYPSKFVVYDARTGEVVDDQNLDQIEAVWGMTVASDQSVYLGTANKRALYRYVPGTVSISGGTKIITGSSLVKTTLDSGMNVIWDVTAGSSGNIYGGTATDGKAFRYNPTSGVTVLNSNLAIVDGLAHVRSIAYASDTEVFMGMGPTDNATIIRFDPTTGTQSTISPSGYGSTYVLGLDYIANGTDSKLFAKLSSEPLIVINPATGVVDASLGNVDSIGVSKKHPTDDKVYYTKGTHLYVYDISAKTQTDLGDVGGKAAGYTFLTDAGTTYLYAPLSSGKILKYKLAATPTIDISTSFTIPDSPTKIRSLVKGPGDHIYTSGYLRGGLSVYHPDTGLLTRNRGAGQAENMTTIGNNLYLGIYPGAWIKKYDTNSSWNDTTNPSLLFQDIAGSPNFQDRPFGMLADPTLNRLYVGTVASSGKLSGSFTVYDLTTSARVTTVLDIVDDQSIIALAYKNNKVYGGSSVYGGIGSTANPSVTEGKVFTWQTTSSNTLPVPQYVPVSGRKVISDLIVGPDGNIWGLAEGNSSTDPSRNLTADLFIFDPNNPDAAHTTIYANKFTSTGNVSWQGGKMVVGKDGNVYVSIGGKLYAVDASSATKDAVMLVSTGVSLLTADANGDLYYVKYETNLYKYDK
ncbi:carbohydrate binding domain-containing protein [Paenibacillus sp. Soil750]|uniref:carbohydrate binding domain-containing protein n=1 Tax=Paenibacillus sp. Soil750 TaxID=1736398 RepID=UPI0006F31F40|nr:carbohydrate binding domain-containing protein [Paenibacillus sp. Soil750]KRE59916.1 hypothetical protein ASL11_27300 [Paenibacillus sp. Soil750]